MNNAKPTSLEELENLLKTFNISTTEWKSKPVATLWKEIDEKDCYLDIINGRLERFVDVARVRCYYEDKQLFEVKQVFHDGSDDRERDQGYVAEKMTIGEDPKVAAKRGLLEELKVRCSKKLLIHHALEDSIQTYNPNPSYKGLHSTYRYFNFSIKFNESQYVPEGYVEAKKDKTTYFSWIVVKGDDEENSLPTVMFDLDNVLTDLETGFPVRWVKKYEREVPVKKEDRSTFDIREDYKKVNPINECLVNAIFREKDFFANLPLMPGALEALNTLKKLGHKVIICTTVLHNPTEMANRLNNLLKTFGDEAFEQLVITRDKTLVLVDATIDDRPHISGVAQSIFEHIIFDHPFNRSELKKQRIKNWNPLWHKQVKFSFATQTIARTEKKVILLDLSNVLLDANECYTRKWREYNPLLQFVPVDEIDAHSISDKYTEFNNANVDYGVLMESIIHEPDIYNTMQFMKGVLIPTPDKPNHNILQEMEDAGFDVYIVTRHFRNGANILGKLQKIQSGLGQKWVDKTIIIRDKSLIQGDILIDDAPVLKDCSRIPNFIQILFGRPCNKYLKDMPRIDDWSNWKSVVRTVLQIAAQAKASVKC